MNPTCPAKNSIYGFRCAIGSGHSGRHQSAGGRTWIDNPIEAEVVSPERARSLVQENDELRSRIGRVEEARDLYRRDALTEERLHGEARRFALAWKEAARSELRVKNVYLNGFRAGLDRIKKFREERDKARTDATYWENTSKALTGAVERWQAHTEKAEKELAQEREWSAAKDAQTDRLVTEVEKAEQEREQAEGALAAYVTAQASRGPRPLTADDVDRALDAAVTSWRTSYPPEDQPYETWKIKQATWSALRVLGLIATEPPSRPEGAEELDPIVDRSIRGCSDITSPETVRAISDGLAESGVRVTGAES